MKVNVTLVILVVLMHFNLNFFWMLFLYVLLSCFVSSLFCMQDQFLSSQLVFVQCSTVWFILRLVKFIKFNST